MKFRLKGPAFQRPALVEFDSNSVTVGDLKSRVAQLLSLTTEERGLLELSLNGKQALATSDEQTLGSLEFVSGDAIYILGTDKNTSLPKQQKLNDPSPNQVNMSDRSAKQEETKGPSFNFTTTAHLPIGDTPANQTPESFNKLLTSYPEKAQVPVEVLGCLLHILMVESGFLPESLSKGDPVKPFSTLPDSWSFVSGTLKLQYKSRMSPNPPCTLVLSVMGPLVMVFGTASGVKTNVLKLKPSEFMTPLSTVGRNLGQLSRDFKNDVAFPLLLSIQRESGGVCPPNLSNLPAELFDKILRLLDAKSLCRLSTTCRRIQGVINEPLLWKRLVSREFGQQLGTPENPSWKDIYKTKHVERREERNAARNRAIVRHQIIPRPHFERRNPPGILPDPEYPIPGIIGGYHDIYGDMPNPFGRRRPNNNRGFPGMPQPRFHGFPPM